MWLLFLLAGCAVLLLATLGAATRAVWRATRNNDEVLQRVAALGHEGRVEDALEVAHGLGGAASAVVVAGLTRHDEGDAETAIAEVAGALRTPFTFHLRLLDWIAFLGVLGPLAGAVDLIGVGPRGLAALRESGELDAFLRLAALGLGVAIVATLGRFWLLARLRRLSIVMEKGAAVVYNTAR